MEVIGSSKQSYFCIHFFFYTSHIINFLSYPPDDISVISKFIEAEFIQFVCPIYELLNFNVSISHNFILLSSLAVNILFPSDVNFTDFTAAVCPFIVFVFILVPGYHNFTVVSYEPLANIF